MNNDEGNGRFDRDERQRPLVVQVQRSKGYGNVADLEDEEPASLRELERQIFMAEWGPILALPVQSVRGGFQAAIDEFGHLDWGAFGTEDFERLHGPFDKARDKIDKLKVELRNAVIMLEMVAANVSGAVIDSLMAGLRSGTIDLEDIADWNEYFFAQRYLRVKRIRNQIQNLRDFVYRRRAQAAGLAG
jgi:hypothetical protein